MDGLHRRSAVELLALLRAGETTPSALVEESLARIERLDSGLGAFVTVTAAAARERAAALDDAPAGALWGLPSADKDLEARAGVPLGAGSRARRGVVPDHSDPVVLAMDEAGAISLGKTSTPEFGLTGYTESAVAPPARDPWDPRSGAGGSSGGSAVAVAAGFVPLAIGSDGGGSVRIPAATVGIVGFKPSRGALSVDRTGGSTGVRLVVHGPLARTVADARLGFEVLRHPGALDPAGLGGIRSVTDTDTDTDTELDAPRRFRIGVTTVSPWDEDEEILLDPTAADAVHAAAGMLTDAGCEVVPLSWRPRGYATLFRTLWRASAANLALDDDDLRLVQPITAWLVAAGRALSPDALAAALAAAEEFRAETLAAFGAVDAVLTPALAQSPRPIGWFDPVDAERNFVQQVQYAPYSSFVNVIGAPAIVLPVTRAPDGHPVSVQLVGGAGGDDTVLRIAAVLEAARGAAPVPPLG